MGYLRVSGYWHTALYLEFANREAGLYGDGHQARVMFVWYALDDMQPNLLSEMLALPPFYTDIIILICARCLDKCVHGTRNTDLQIELDWKSINVNSWKFSYGFFVSK